MMSAEGADAKPVLADTQLTTDLLKAWSKDYKARKADVLKSEESALRHLEDVVLVAGKLTPDSLEQKCIDAAIADVIIPASTHYLSRPAPEDLVLRGKVTQLLLQLAGVACRLFKQSAAPSSQVTRMLKTINDPTRRYFRQSDSKSQIAHTTNALGIGTVSENMLDDRRPVADSSVAIALPMDVAGYSEAAATKSLQVIPEEQQQGQKERITKIIDDDDERLAEYTVAKFAVGSRKDKTAEASNLVQVFLSELGEFQKYFSNAYPIEAVVRYIEVWVAVSEMLYTQHLRDIFPQLTGSISAYFSSLEEQNIKALDKDLMEATIMQIEKLFDRLNLTTPKYKWLETFMVELTLKMIRSKTLRVKILGAKILGEMSNKIHHDQSKFIRELDHKQWLVDNKVFDQLISLDSHEQVILSSGDIVKFLIRTNSFKTKELKHVLQLVEKADPATRRTILKPVSEVSMRFFDPEVLVIHDWLRSREELWNEEMIEMLYYTSRYSSQSIFLAGLQILWQIITKSYEKYPQNGKERLTRRLMDLLSGGLEANKFSDPNKYLINMAQQFTREPSCHMLQFLRKYVQCFPNTTQETRYPSHKRTSFDLVKSLIEVTKFHEVLLQLCTNSKNSGVLRKQSVDMLVFLVMKYKDQVASEDYLNAHMLLTLTHYSSIFVQLLHYFRESAEQLFQMVVSRGIDDLEAFQCVKELFGRINRDSLLQVLKNSEKKYQVKVPPETLNGYQQLLHILETSPSKAVREEVAAFLCMLYTSCQREQAALMRIKFNDLSDKLIEKTKQDFTSKKYKALLGDYTMLEEMMNYTETAGVGKLQPHSGLVCTESVNILVNNQVTYGYYLPRKHQFKFPSNKTLYDLLVELAGKFKCAPAEIQLKKYQQEIKQRYNGLTIQQLELRDTELTAHRIEREPIPKATLIEDGKLTQKATQVFTELFFRFSPSGNMTPQELARFVEESTNDSCTASDSRVTGVFTRFDKDKDNVLSLQDFLNFFEDSSRFRDGVVWRNLEVLRYRNDLQKEEEVVQQVHYQSMVRYRIYQHQLVYDSLFEMSLSEDASMREKAITLLKRLPTDRKTVQQMLSHADFSSTDEFSVWYRLTLVQYLLNSQQSNKLQSSEAYNIPPERIAEWKNKFIDEKLYLKILSEAERISGTNIKDMTDTSRSCLSLCLQILRSLSDIPHLNKPLPEQYCLRLVDIPPNQLISRILPQLYELMIGELLQPLLCMLLQRRQKLQLSVVLPGLFHRDEQARIICSNFLYIYQKEHKFQLDLFSIQPDIKYCRQYFKLLVRLMADDQSIDLQNMLLQVVEWLTSYQVQQGITINKEDHLLQGKLQLLENIVVLEPNLLPKEELFQDMLLAKLDRTLSTANRDILYRLLLRTNTGRLVPTIHNMLIRVEPKKPGPAKATGYVGLTNLGCICYMNAMMQQLFMTKEFKYALLSIDLSDRNILVAERKGKKYRDSLLLQLQRTFGYLQLSERGDFNPEQFCYSFRSDINFGIQEDSQEFLNMLFEKLERELKGTSFPRVLNDVFGGRTIVSMKCQSCHMVKYRIEQFNNLSLEVKDRKSIDESLERFIESEQISDFFCENCQQKSAVDRSQHLYSLPNTLIVHLQRIIFSYQTYERIKIHTALSFPTKLNLHQYVLVPEDGEEEVQAPTEEQCSYELKGVVIHSGHAESGHYYSLIRDVTGSWFKFDDSRVTSFNSSEISHESYGGKEEYADYNSFQTGSSSKNAYMLVYEKTRKQLITIQRSRLRLLSSAFDIADDDRNSELAKITTFNSYIRQELRKEVSNDNDNVFFHELQVYNKNFYKFVKSLLLHIPIPKALFEQAENHASPYYSGFRQLSPSIRLLFSSVMSMLHRLVEFLSTSPECDQQLVKEITVYLSLLYYAIPDVTQIYFLSLDAKRHVTIMTSHADQQLRELYRIVLNRCFSSTVAFSKVDLQNVDDSSPTRLKLLDHLRTICNQMPELSQNPTKIKQYFQFWRHFCFTTPTFMQYCFNQEFLTRLVGFVLQKRSPLAHSIKQQISQESISAALPPIVSTIAAMLMNSNLSGKGQLKHNLTPNELKCLNFMPFYRQIIDSDSDLSSLVSIVECMATGNRAFSQEFAKLLLQGVNQFTTYKSALAYMTVVKEFLTLEDELVQHRLDMLLGVPQYISEGDDDYALKASLHSQTVSYLSSLFFNGEYKPVLQLLFEQRRSPDSSSIAGVNILLQLLDGNETALRYVTALPPPNNFYAKYTDWIDEFIGAFRTQKYIILTADRQKVADNCQKLLRGINITIDRIIEQEHKPTELPQPNVLPSFFPLWIVGRNQRTELLEPLDLTFGDTKIQVTAKVHYTYIKLSQPTGANNLSLPKETFNTFNLPADKEKQNLELIKYFTYNTLPLSNEISPPEVQPTIITLTINSNVDLWLVLSHPVFTHELKLAEGRSKVNVPYTTQPIHSWIYVKSSSVPKIVAPPPPAEAAIPAAMAVQTDSHANNYSAVPSQLREVACEACTYVNFGRSICEMCDTALP